MIHGAHMILFSSDAEADRQFLKDQLELPFVDAGHGWLIFGLPPSELAIHPGEAPSGPMAQAALYFMCSDIDEAISDLSAKGAECDEITSENWGRASAFSLPSGARIGIYEPHHPTAI